MIFVRDNKKSRKTQRGKKTRKKGVIKDKKGKNENKIFSVSKSEKLFERYLLKNRLQ